MTVSRDLEQGCTQVVHYRYVFMAHCQKLIVENKISPETRLHSRNSNIGSRSSKRPRHSLRQFNRKAANFAFSTGIEFVVSFNKNKKYDVWPAESSFVGWSAWCILKNRPSDAFPDFPTTLDQVAAFWRNRISIGRRWAVLTTLVLLQRRQLWSRSEQVRALAVQAAQDKLMFPPVKHRNAGKKLITRISFTG